MSFPVPLQVHPCKLLQKLLFLKLPETTSDSLQLGAIWDSRVFSKCRMVNPDGVRGFPDSPVKYLDTNEVPFYFELNSGA